MPLESLATAPSILSGELADIVGEAAIESKWPAQARES